VKDLTHQQILLLRW